jgi:hypothetical protein
MASNRFTDIWRIILEDKGHERSGVGRADGPGIGDGSGARNASHRATLMQPEKHDMSLIEILDRRDVVAATRRLSKQ